MKNKIWLRLLLYFSGSLLVFSLVIGLVFFSPFFRHNLDTHKAELGRRAGRIAATLAGLESGGAEHAGHGHGQGLKGPGMGFGAYLRFLEDIALTDIWVVDRNLEQIMRGHGQTSLGYKDLPPGAEKVVAAALAGRLTFSEKFGAFLGTPSLTVATPIVLSDGEIVGAVLLHERIENIRGTTKNGLVILLLSMGAAIAVSFLIAGALAGHFTKPLRRMKTTAQQISNGDYTATTGIVQDDEIGELALALDGMAVRLGVAARESARLEKMRQDFIANISHELRTPVTVIRGSLEALRDGVVTAPGLVEDYHKQMLAESIYLERLVTDLLNLARLQNPDFAMEMEKVDLQEIAADALRAVGRLAGEKGLKLKFDAVGGNFALQGDYGRLRQMLVIVLDNAVKFSPEGAAVQLELRQPDEGGMVLSIRDEGPGIPPAELPAIFERFHRRRSEENKSGTGLGLAIAQQIAARHGITIDVQSQPGRGTTFYFYFKKS